MIRGGERGKNRFLCDLLGWFFAAVKETLQGMNVSNCCA
jgi:hypothetical protein